MQPEKEGDIEGDSDDDGNDVVADRNERAAHDLAGLFRLLSEYPRNDSHARNEPNSSTTRSRYWHMGSREGIAQEKGALAEALGPGGWR